MNTVILIIAGCLGMLIALAHGILGNAMINRSMGQASPTAKRVLQAIMFLSAVYWFFAGAIITISPFYFAAHSREIAALVAGAIFLTAAVANCWATRGRHFGWPLLTITAGLIWLGT